MFLLPNHFISVFLRSAPPRGPRLRASSMVCSKRARRKQRGWPLWSKNKPYHLPLLSALSSPPPSSGSAVAALLLEDLHASDSSSPTISVVAALLDSAVGIGDILPPSHLWAMWTLGRHRRGQAVRLLHH